MAKGEKAAGKPADASESFFGTEADENFSGGAANDIALGGGGADTLSGGGGNDYLAGGAGDDRIEGGDGADLLYGGAGDDLLILGDGDTAHGEDGADRFVFSAVKEAHVILSDFDPSEGDTLAIELRGNQTWSLSDSGTHATLEFSSGATIDLYGVTAEEILAAPELYGLA